PLAALGAADPRRRSVRAAALLPVLPAAGVSGALRELGGARLARRRLDRRRARAEGEARERRSALQRRCAAARAGATLCTCGGSARVRHRISRDEVVWAFGPDRVPVPAMPMVGVVGVATDGEELSNGLAGRHGGNLDDHWHGAGAKIFFPVRQPGGMFAVGDMHAAMGDGEICFTGVEIAGEVDIRFGLLKGKQATWPVTELAERWLPHATAAEFGEALQLVSEEAARLLVDEHGFSIEDAFIF